MTKKIILAAFVAAMSFTSCHKDPTPTPTPDPTPTPAPETVTRLASEKTVKAVGTMTMNMDRYYTWENGIMTHQDDTIITPIIDPTIYHNNMVYENGNLTKIEEESGVWEYTFTYENGLLKNFLNILHNDTSAWGEVVAYTEDGYVREIMAHDNFKTTRWSLIWANGDATEVKEEILEPEELVATHVYTYTYDDKPCIYTGTPLAFAMPDGNGDMVARRMSKHNQIQEGYVYNYDENGLLISIVSESDSTFYQYIEQTIE